MRLGLSYTHRTKLGYGRMGVKLHAALERAGVEIYEDVDIPVTAANNAYLDESVGWSKGVAKDVLWCSVPAHVPGQYEGQRTHILTMWETTFIPEAFRETLSWFDRVLVPSRQNVRLFSQYHDEVHYTPLGIDPDEWHYTPRQESSEFRFLIGGSGPRKGVDLAQEAFHKVFPDPASMDPTPVLILKSPRGGVGSHFVRVVAGFIDDDAERELYATSHVYLQPSRGEGFGLQPLQALAQGMPTILTDAHGHAGFAHLGIPIPATEEPTSAPFMWGDAENWWEPDLEAVCEAMWDTYHHYAEHLDRAKHSSEVVARDWTWDQTARHVIEALPDLNEAPPAARCWWEPKRQLYRAQVRVPWKADVAGIMYLFEPGQDYAVPADVKRILFEVGVLDPDCLYDTGNGLSEEQVDRIGMYRAEHAHCPTCGQRVNSQPTKADELYAAVS